MTVVERPVAYAHDGVELEGLLVSPAEGGPRPAVIIFHAFCGRGENEAAAARRLATLGYAGIAADLYGKGVFGRDRDECGALMKPFMDDRRLLRERLLAVLDAVRALPEVDAEKVAAVGYCFGGLCAIDLARSGADVRGVASFHGLLGGLPPELAGPIQAKIVAFHGWDDPLAPPADVVALGAELTRAGADWQLHAYGNTMHAFTNPKAQAPELGLLYNPIADARSWASLEAFLAEIFE